MAEQYQAESERIRYIYAHRDGSAKPQLYEWHRPDILLTQYQLREAISRAIVKFGWLEFSGKDVLDVGCGSGGWLRGLLEWGAEPSRLHGVDLLPDRIMKARAISSNIDFQVSTGWPLPFEANSMDMVSAHTVFSSILDNDARVGLAEEMIRVMKPGGLILVYDFRISDPRNPDTIGINRKEINRLFPGMNCEKQSLILAPPISRKVAKFSPWMVIAMERCFPFLRTHAVYTLNKT